MGKMSLLSKEQLLKKHPALGRKRYTLDWLVRTRRIPVVKVGRYLFFDEDDIDAWIKSKRLPAIEFEYEERTPRRKRNVNPIPEGMGT
jgi:hypothetical protein